jgi:hypothetical protein
MLFTHFIAKIVIRYLSKSTIKRKITHWNNAKVKNKENHTKVKKTLKRDSKKRFYKPYIDKSVKTTLINYETFKEVPIFTSNKIYL